jgi:hypothetical protein
VRGSRWSAPTQLPCHRAQPASSSAFPRPRNLREMPVGLRPLQIARCSWSEPCEMQGRFPREDFARARMVSRRRSSWGPQPPGAAHCNLQDLGAPGTAFCTGEPDATLARARDHQVLRSARPLLWRAREVTSVVGVLVCFLFSLTMILTLGPIYDRHARRARAALPPRSPDEERPTEASPPSIGHGSPSVNPGRQSNAQRRPVAIGGFACRTVPHGAESSPRSR